MKQPGLVSPIVEQVNKINHVVGKAGENMILRCKYEYRDFKDSYGNPYSLSLSLPLSLSFSLYQSIYLSIYLSILFALHSPKHFNTMCPRGRSNLSWKIGRPDGEVLNLDSTSRKLKVKMGPETVGLYHCYSWGQLVQTFNMTQQREDI